jgi:hypothetical protein
LIYPDELKIKDTTESNKSTSYRDILLNIDSNGRLTTSLYDKHDDFDFAVVNFPFLCRKIPAGDAYSSAEPDPTFTFVGGQCCPTLDFVVAFRIMITFYTLLSSLFCIEKLLVWLKTNKQTNTIYSVMFMYSMTFEYCVTDQWIQSQLNISSNRKACYMENFMIFILVEMHIWCIKIGMVQDLLLYLNNWWYMYKLLIEMERDSLYSISVY